MCIRMYFVVIILKLVAEKQIKLCVLWQYQMLDDSPENNILSSSISPINIIPLYRFTSKGFPNKNCSLCLLRVSVTKSVLISAIWFFFNLVTLRYQIGANMIIVQKLICRIIPSSRVIFLKLWPTECMRSWKPNFPKRNVNLFGSELFRKSSIVIFKGCHTSIKINQYILILTCIDRTYKCIIINSKLRILNSAFCEG